MHDEKYNDAIQFVAASTESEAAIGDGVPPPVVVAAISANSEVDSVIEGVGLGESLGVNVDVAHGEGPGVSKDVAAVSSATEPSDLMSTTRVFMRKFAIAIVIAFVLGGLTTWMQNDVCYQIHPSAGRIGLSFTLAGSFIALAFLLLRLYYPQGKNDAVTKTIWLAYQYSIGSVIFGVLMWLMGFVWGIYPNFLQPEMLSISFVQREMQEVPSLYVNGYVGLCAISLWPVVALLYCGLRYVCGKLWQSTRRKPVG